MTRPINPWKVTGYKAGQNVVCKVTKAETGGYAVIIPKDNLPGFIQTTAALRPGEEILAQFVCVHNNRILLSPLFSGNRASGASLPTSSQVNWAEHLDNPEQIDEILQQRQSETQSNYQAPSAPENYEQSYAPPQEEAQQAHSDSTIYAPDYSQNTNQQYQPAIATPEQTGSVTGFTDSQWQAPIEQTPTKRFRLRRAIDLVMPPLDQESLTTMKMSDYDLEWLITDLEGGMRTGCMKCTSEQALSRSAVLLYRGKAVGCIYGCKSSPDARPTEESLTSMLTDLEAPDATVMVYDLPEEVTVAMASLFLGFPVERDESLDPKTQFDYFMTYFTQNGNTACLAITLPSTKSTYLVFVHKGKFGGAFFVEEQVYTQDPADIYQLFVNDSGARVEASFLQPEMIAAGSRFGYSLSMAKQKRQ